jgi:hypothetical protein
MPRDIFKEMYGEELARPGLMAPQNPLDALQPQQQPFQPQFPMMPREQEQSLTLPETTEEFEQEDIEYPYDTTAEGGLGEIPSTAQEFSWDEFKKSPSTSERSWWEVVKDWGTEGARLGLKAGAVPSQAIHGLINLADMAFEGLAQATEEVQDVEVPSELRSPVRGAVEKGLGEERRLMNLPTFQDIDNLFESVFEVPPPKEGSAAKFFQDVSLDAISMWANPLASLSLPRALFMSTIGDMAYKTGQSLGLPEGLNSVLSMAMKTLAGTAGGRGMAELEKERLYKQSDSVIKNKNIIGTDLYDESKALKSTLQKGGQFAGKKAALNTIKTFESLKNKKSNLIPLEKLSAFKKDLIKEMAGMSYDHPSLPAMKQILGIVNKGVKNIAPTQYPSWGAPYIAGENLHKGLSYGGRIGRFFDKNPNKILGVATHPVTKIAIAGLTGKFAPFLAAWGLVPVAALEGYKVGKLLWDSPEAFKIYGELGKNAAMGQTTSFLTNVKKLDKFISNAMKP